MTIKKVLDLFDLENGVYIVTGGAGLLGRKHADAILEANGQVALFDVNWDNLVKTRDLMSLEYQKRCFIQRVDVTSEASVVEGVQATLAHFDRIDGLINNAAIDAKVAKSGTLVNSSRLENFSLEQWNKEISVGLTGAFLMTKHVGPMLAQNQLGGSIINISSDLGLIAPDQRLYRQCDVSEDSQNVKPVTYSAIKSALIGLTRYTAGYWAEQNVRCNAFCPGGVYNLQPEEFVVKLKRLIPMARMAQVDEYKGCIVFLLSKASSYMTGAVVVADGGRTVL